jgi:hypothetical protein
MEAILILATLAQHWRLEAQSGQPLRLLPTITLAGEGPGVGADVA